MEWLNELRDWAMSLKLKDGPGYQVKYDTDGIGLKLGIITSQSNTLQFKGEFDATKSYKKGDIVAITASMPELVPVAGTSLDPDHYLKLRNCTMGLYICVKDWAPIMWEGETMYDGLDWTPRIPLWGQSNASEHWQCMSQDCYDEYFQVGAPDGVASPRSRIIVDIVDKQPVFKTQISKTGTGGAIVNDTSIGWTMDAALTADHPMAFREIDVCVKQEDGSFKDGKMLCFCSEVYFPEEV